MKSVPNARLQLTGHIEYIERSGYDMGTLGRPFIASVVAPAGASSSGGAR